MIRVLAFITAFVLGLAVSADLVSHDARTGDYTTSFEVQHYPTYNPQLTANASELQWTVEAPGSQKPIRP